MEDKKEEVFSEPNDSIIKTLGDRMKSYEFEHEQKIDPNKPYIIRLDGHKFSTYTRPFKSFDTRFANVMRETAKDLITKFSPATVFTCSDEISLLFPLRDDEEENTNEDAQSESTTPDQSKKATLPWSGRVQKISSLVASFASVCFDRHMREQQFDEREEERLIAHVKSAVPHFDARIFNVPTNAELVNNIMWRSHFDFRRNSISSLAREYYSAKQLHKLNSSELIAKLKEEKNVDWFSMDDQFKYGLFIKKEKYNKTVEIKGNVIDAVRTRPVVKSFALDKYTKENEDFICSKYLPQTDNTL